MVGCNEGNIVGEPDGAWIGALEGNIVGEPNGAWIGEAVGCGEGNIEGATDGALEGPFVDWTRAVGLIAGAWKGPLELG
jgi:hypothetical protein